MRKRPTVGDLIESLMRHGNMKTPVSILDRNCDLRDPMLVSGTTMNYILIQPNHCGPKRKAGK